MRQTTAMAEADRTWMVDTLLALLQTPSPAGRTDAVMQLIGDIFDGFGVPFSLTRRGALTAELPGESATTDRALVVHADTIGCMVRRLKDNGRLEVIPVGTFSARFAAGARVRIFSDDPDEFITGTVLPLKASGHAFGDEIDLQPTDWEHVEVRVDRQVHSREDLVRLGLQIGDFVALIASPELTADGYIVSRHLDGKAGVAIALALAKNFAENKVVLPHRTMVMITITEEVGHGASHGLPADVAELVSVDNAVCAPGQHSIEDGVTIPMADLHGPFDYHLTRKLCRLAEEQDIRCARDVFRFYRSDAAAAIEAGAGTRAALVGFGLDGSHGWERTHLDSLQAVYCLLHSWLQTPLTFAKWDAKPSGKLRDFPSSKQPAPSERWVPLARGEHDSPGEASPGSHWPPSEGPQA
ncbi:MULTISPECIES: osmoprotectant NAGGN system M42 family peptidase [unclassified Mycobacterium]|uniref:osmoprotectant NAGGN system M42 family peptidase n=1 Tax=unclassified Mycobacterium TaxID=2642494 RepID=UPI0008009D46|nr:MULTISPECIES: osmoprotectant NAGGN system M42 family peptidase [unclassified Mycobacterium]OBG65217.1 peptidase M42 [Mycobacterium sp. E188]OBG65454.1 peptidase M42 [Mycobacterium sp. E735]OBG70444.1 peptidase M42 [Mycobacterium sp. E3298]OBG79208.1 peptidase M42 [Mycobacterium sp. E3305]OBH15966.1 peptidase M42 [Mycobacterium sp. E1715]